MASPLGTKGDQAGIWQPEMCLRVLAALSAAAKGAGAAEYAGGSEVGFGYGFSSENRLFTQKYLLIFGDGCLYIVN